MPLSTVTDSLRNTSCGEHLIIAAAANEATELNEGHQRATDAARSAHMISHTLRLLSFRWLHKIKWNAIALIHFVLPADVAVTRVIHIGLVFFVSCWPLWINLSGVKTQSDTSRFEKVSLNVHLPLQLRKSLWEVFDWLCTDISLYFKLNGDYFSKEGRDTDGY